MGEYSTPKVNAITKRVINEAYGAGFSVKQIKDYFGFKQARVYQYLDCRGRKSLKNRLEIRN